MTARELKETALAVQYEKVMKALFLTDRQRTLMEMKYIRGLLYKEMADILNCSEQCIKSEFMKINAKLAKIDLSKL